MSFEDMIRAIIREELEPLRREVAELRAEIEQAKKYRNRQYLTIEQVAKRTTLGKSTIYERGKTDPTFPPIRKFWGRSVIEVGELEEWEDRQIVPWKGVTA